MCAMCPCVSAQFHSVTMSMVETANLTTLLKSLDAFSETYKTRLRTSLGASVYSLINMFSIIRLPLSYINHTSDHVLSPMDCFLLYIARDEVVCKYLLENQVLSEWNRSVVGTPPAAMYPSEQSTLSIFEQVLSWKVWIIKILGLFALFSWSRDHLIAQVPSRAKIWPTTHADQQRVARSNNQCVRYICAYMCLQQFFDVFQCELALKYINWITSQWITLKYIKKVL